MPRFKSYKRRHRGGHGGGGGGRPREEGLPVDDAIIDAPEPQQESQPQAQQGQSPQQTAGGEPFNGGAEGSPAPIVS